MWWWWWRRWWSLGRDLRGQRWAGSGFFLHLERFVVIVFGEFFSYHVRRAFFQFLECYRSIQQAGGPMQLTVIFVNGSVRSANWFLAVRTVSLAHTFRFALIVDRTLSTFGTVVRQTWICVWMRRINKRVQNIKYNFVFPLTACCNLIVGKM